MTSSELKVYYDHVTNSYRPPFIRDGQHLFNKLYELHPDLADSIRGNNTLDPFYVDSRIPAFYKFLEDMVRDDT